MNKRIHLLPLFVALLIIGMLFTFTAHAAEEPPVTSDAPVVSTPETPVESVPQPPVTSDTPVVSTPETPVTSDPVVDSQPETPVTSDPVYEPETPDTSDVVVSGPNTGNNYVDSYTHDDGYYYYDEDEMVNNIEDYAGNVSELCRGSQALRRSLYGLRCRLDFWQKLPVRQRRMDHQHG